MISLNIDSNKLIGNIPLFCCSNLLNSGSSSSYFLLFLTTVKLSEFNDTLVLISLELLFFKVKLSSCSSWFSFSFPSDFFLFLEVELLLLLFFDFVFINVLPPDEFNNV